MIKTGINILGLAEIFGGDFAGVLDVARRAERRGIEQITLGEHLGMTPSGLLAKGSFPYSIEFPWMEPIATLSAIAAVTERIRLSTNVLVAPLRPALLLAKQVATLDCISGGRVSICFGVGWQREEFAAVGVPFEGRYGLLVEQVEACRALWGGAPAGYAGRHIAFEEMHARPLPVQGADLEISLGLPATPRNVARMARLGTGWNAAYPQPAVVRAGVEALRAAWVAEGRDLAALRTGAGIRPPLRADGGPDYDGALEFAQLLVDAGLNRIEPFIYHFCRRPGEIDGFLDWVAALRSLAPRTPLTNS